MMLLDGDGIFDVVGEREGKRGKKRQGDGSDGCRVRVLTKKRREERTGRQGGGVKKENQRQGEKGTVARD